MIKAIKELWEMDKTYTVFFGLWVMAVIIWAIITFPLIVEIIKIETGA